VDVVDEAQRESRQTTTERDRDRDALRVQEGERFLRKTREEGGNQRDVIHFSTSVGQAIGAV